MKKLENCIITAAAVDNDGVNYEGDFYLSNNVHISISNYTGHFQNMICIHIKTCMETRTVERSTHQ